MSTENARVVLRIRIPGHGGVNNLRKVVAQRCQNGGQTRDISRSWVRAVAPPRQNMPGPSEIVR